MIHHSIDNPRNEDDADEGARQRDDLKPISADSVV